MGTSATDREATWAHDPQNKCGTGGGVSAVFPRPLWQFGVVPSSSGDAMSDSAHGGEHQQPMSPASSLSPSSLSPSSPPTIITMLAGGKGSGTCGGSSHSGSVSVSGSASASACASASAAGSVAASGAGGSSEGMGDGRGVPDIALNADPERGWVICFNSRLVTVGGTSCVAPAVAGFLAIVNLRYSLGFNSALYTIWKNVDARQLVFKAIRANDDDDDGKTTMTTSGPRSTGKSSMGYDFCTGLGAFNGAQLYQSLKELLVKDPSIVQDRVAATTSPAATAPVSAAGKIMPVTTARSTSTTTGTVASTYKRTPEEQAAITRAFGWRLLFV